MIISDQLKIDLEMFGSVVARRTKDKKKPIIEIRINPVCQETWKQYHDKDGFRFFPVKSEIKTSLYLSGETAIELVRELNKISDHDYGMAPVIRYIGGHGSEYHGAFRVRTEIMVSMLAKVFVKDGYVGMVVAGNPKIGRPSLVFCGQRGTPEHRIVNSFKSHSIISSSRVEDVSEFYRVEIVGNDAFFYLNKMKDTLPDELRAIVTEYNAWAEANLVWKESGQSYDPEDNLKHEGKIKEFVDRIKETRMVKEDGQRRTDQGTDSARPEGGIDHSGTGIIDDVPEV